MKQSMVGSEKQNQIGTAFAMGKNTRSKVRMIGKNNCSDVTAQKLEQLREVIALL